MAVEENVKGLLGLEADDAKIQICIDLANSAVRSRLNYYGYTQATVPSDLDHVVTEAAIARYNRIGSEGMSSESLDGHSAAYTENILDQYDGEIRRVAFGANNPAHPKGGKVWVY